MLWLDDDVTDDEKEPTMTTPDGTAPMDVPVDAALAAAVSDGDQSAAVAALAGQELILPQTTVGEEGISEDQVTLPVIEQNETSYVPVFTTVQRLTDSLPGIAGSIAVSAQELAMAWPSDELWLAVNPGDQLTSVALPPDAVRSLAVVG